MMRMRGFSLIELVIVIAIISILAMLVYPSYTDYIVRARRADGQGALMDLAARMERYYAEHNTYAGATIAANGTTDVLSSVTTQEAWYNLAIQSGATTYTLTATPNNAQAAQDTKCTSLTLNNLGVKGNTGTGSVNDCW